MTETSILLLAVSWDCFQLLETALVHRQLKTRLFVSSRPVGMSASAVSLLFFNKGSPDWVKLIQNKFPFD